MVLSETLLWLFFPFVCFDHFTTLYCSLFFYRHNKYFRYKYLRRVSYNFSLIYMSVTSLSLLQSSLNFGVAMYLFIAKVPLNIAQVPLHIVCKAHVAAIAIPGFTDVMSQ